MFSTIRVKTSFIVCITLLGLVLSLYSLSSRILNANLDMLEAQETIESVQRVTDSLSQRLETMDDTARSWSQWDATVKFLHDRNRAYYNENLLPVPLDTIKSNVIVLLDAKGNIVFGTNHNLADQTNVPLDPEIKALLNPNNPILSHSSTKSRHAGILCTPHRMLLVLTRPVVNNFGTGKIHGTLLIGNYLDPAELRKLSLLTHLQISLQRLAANQSSAGPQAVTVAWTSDTTVEEPASDQHALAGLKFWIAPVDENIVAGFATLPDVYGQQAVLLRVDVKRDIFQTGQLGIRSVLASLLISCSIFGVIAIFSLEKMVLSRVTRLADEVSLIGTNGESEGHVSVVGHDEISELGNNINLMVSELHSSYLRSRQAGQPPEDPLLK